MRTSDLIDQLSSTLSPTPAGQARRRLGWGLALGAMVAVAAVLVILGWRPDFGAALGTWPLWMKWIFGLTLAAAAMGSCYRLSRPEGKWGRMLPLALAAPFLVLGAAGLAEISRVPNPLARTLWLGHSAVHCPWIIASLAVPVTIGVLWAMRGLAPTRLRWAGFAAGCLGGAVGVMAYAIYCTESAASFVATWYSAGVLMPALLGWAIGPRVLRW
jgi:hypothetical protein